MAGTEINNNDDKVTRWIIRTGWFLMILMIISVFGSVVYLVLLEKAVPVIIADIAKVLLGFICGLMTKLVDAFTSNSIKE